MRSWCRTRCGLWLCNAAGVRTCRRTAGAFVAGRGRLLVCGRFLRRAVAGFAGGGQRRAAKREARETNGHFLQDVLVHLSANLSGLFALTREQGEFPREF